jgi:hypothetical protein
VKAGPLSCTQIAFMEDELTTAKQGAPAKTSRKRERLTDATKVYFAAKTGHLPIVSDDHKVVDHRGTKEKIPGLHLEFGDRGVTRPFDPSDPADAKFIAEVRKWLAEGRDERIAAFKVREIKSMSDAPPIPFPKWDESNAKSIAEFVKVGGYDVRDCILYEEQHGNRADVLAALDALSDTGQETPDFTEAPSL